MQLTFKVKLIALIAVAACSSLLVLWVSVALSERVETQLVLISDRYIPQMELGPQLEQYVQAVVLKDGSSQQRLVDELRLFVGHVQEGLPATLRGVAPPASTTAVSLRGTKILLADDDMRTAYSLAALLQGRGAEVLVAETGLEALSTLAAHTDIRAVLMDIMMPEMDGYEAMRRLRAEGKHAHPSDRRTDGKGASGRA